MAPRYRVTLTKDKREYLESISTKGKRAARTVLYARALLLLDAGYFGSRWLAANAAEALGITTRSLEHVKRRFTEEGPTAAIECKKRVKPPREIQLSVLKRQYLAGRIDCIEKVRTKVVAWNIDRNNRQSKIRLAIPYSGCTCKIETPLSETLRCTLY